MTKKEEKRHHIVPLMQQIKAYNQTYWKLNESKG